MIYKTLKKLKKFKKAVDRKKIRWYYIRALAVTKLSVKYTRSSGVVVNMPPCHGGDRGFESHLDRQLIEMFRCGTFFMGLFHCMPNFLWDLRKE